MTKYDKRPVWVQRGDLLRKRRGALDAYRRAKAAGDREGAMMALSDADAAGEGLLALRWGGVVCRER